jgi:hypothetical protein
MQSCLHLYLSGLNPSGEVVEIPCGSESVASYFVLGANRGRKKPALICVNGEGEPKDEHLYRIAGRAVSKGLSPLLVDLPGQPMNVRRSRSSDRHEVEVAINASFDYLLGRGDVDGKRIAIYGDGAGASHAARAASAAANGRSSRTHRPVELPPDRYGYSVRLTPPSLWARRRTPSAIVHRYSAKAGRRCHGRKGNRLGAAPSVRDSQTFHVGIGGNRWPFKPHIGGIYVCDL